MSRPLSVQFSTAREALAAAPEAVRIIEFDDYAGDVFEGIARSIAFLAANGESL